MSAPEVARKFTSKTAIRLSATKSSATLLTFLSHFVHKINIDANEKCETKKNEKCFICNDDHVETELVSSAPCVGTSLSSSSFTVFASLFFLHENFYVGLLAVNGCIRETVHAQIECSGHYALVLFR